MPEEVPSGFDGVAIRDLPGGRYAAVHIEKDPRAIGDSIGHFYQEHVPQNNIQIDGVRPTYEIYSDSTIDYYVPIL